MAVSPNVSNYSVAKGAVYFTPDGTSGEIHLGNVNSMQITPEIEKLDHFSSMAGVRSKDKSVVVEKSANLTIVMEEITATNLSLALLGTVITNTAANEEFELFGVDEVMGAIRFAGSNTIGNTVNWDLPNCTFIPGSSFDVISDEWQQIEVTAEVTDEGAGFGSVEVVG